MTNATPRNPHQPRLGATVATTIPTAIVVNATCPMMRAVVHASEVMTYMNAAVRTTSGVTIHITTGWGLSAFGLSIVQAREPLINYRRRHAGENQHPVNNCFYWIPACAGMTT